jgi:hypothetical protein
VCCDKNSVEAETEGIMGQSIGTLFGGNLGLGNSVTADQVAKNLSLTGYTAIVTGM